MTGDAAPVDYVDVRTITVGPVHAERGDPRNVAVTHGWLLANPDRDVPPLDGAVQAERHLSHPRRPHRVLAYVLAERPMVPIEVGCDDGGGRARGAPGRR